VSITYRPIPIWPHGSAQDRQDSAFRAGWDQTVADLEYEVGRLQKRDQSLIIEIGAGYRPGDVRRDGTPRADARAPLHPGVEVSFDSRHGRLTYATDIFRDWRDNVRAIALGLEALRSLDRWGVAKQGQQYQGFNQLTAGPSLETLGAELVQKYGSVNAALRAAHPDTGTSADASDRSLQAVVAFRDREKEVVTA
jgi:hypothetical protein